MNGPKTSSDITTAMLILFSGFIIMIIVASAMPHNQNQENAKCQTVK